MSPCRTRFLCCRAPSKCNFVSICNFNQADWLAVCKISIKNQPRNLITLDEFFRLVLHPSHARLVFLSFHFAFIDLPINKINIFVWLNNSPKCRVKIQVKRIFVHQQTHVRTHSSSEREATVSENVFVYPCAFFRFGLHKIAITHFRV